MGMNDLLKKLENQPQTVEQVFEANRNQWIADVGELLTTIEGWLSPLVQARHVRLERRTIQIDDPDTGPYDVAALTIFLADREVKVEPRGMRIVGVIPGKDRIVGARGRVDVVSGPSRATILRSASGQWQLAAVDGWPASTSAVDLTGDVFADVLAELLPSSGP